MPFLTAFAFLALLETLASYVSISSAAVAFYKPVLALVQRSRNHHYRNEHWSTFLSIRKQCVVDQGPSNFDL